MKNFRKINVLECLNVSRHISNHLIGEDHTIVHRKVVGFGIMVFGVALHKLFLIVHVDVIEFFGDVVGFAIHGMGLTPFVESILQKSKQ